MNFYNNPEIEKQFNEFKSLNENFQLSLQETTRKQFILLITINPILINQENKIEFLDDIHFILLIKHNYPQSPPILYSISKFCHPEICDCRDLLEDTIQSSWKKNPCTLKQLIEKIPNFINNYILNITKIENENIMIGKYYLDSIYDEQIIENCPFLYFDCISEIFYDKDDRIYVEDRKILLTENFLLLFVNKSLFEIDQLKLIFVGPIKSLAFIRQKYKDNIIELKWKIKGKNKFQFMNLRTGDANFIVDTLIENLSKKSIGYKVSDKIFNAKKEGKIPLIEISLVEKEISELELKLKNENIITTKEMIKTLLNFYERAIQYYSALNDEKFKLYLQKIKNIYSNEQYTSLLNKIDLNTNDNLIENNDKKNNEGVFSISVNDENDKEKNETKSKDKKEDIKIDGYNLDSDDDEDYDEDEKDKNKNEKLYNGNNIIDIKNEDKGNKDNDIKKETINKIGDVKEK